MENKRVLEKLSILATKKWGTTQASALSSAQLRKEIY